MMKELAVLADANIPFTVNTKHKEVYIGEVLILYGGIAFVTPVKYLESFDTAWTSGTPLKNLKLKDIQPMIEHYRKFHPAAPEISSRKV